MDNFTYFLFEMPKKKKKLNTEWNDKIVALEKTT